MNVTEQTADQAPVQSAEDRVASIFENSVLGRQPAPPEPQTDANDAPQEEAQAEPEQPPAEQFAEIEWNGNKYQVPVDLKDGFMMQSDYTKKTQEVAEMRRAAEVEAAQIKAFQMERAFAQKVETDQRQLGAYDTYIESLAQQLQQVDLNAVPFEQVFKVKLELDRAKEARQKIADGIESKRQEFQAELTKHFDEQRAKGREALQKLIPSFSDATIKELHEYATKTLGLSQMPLEALESDPRIAQAMWKAQQYDRLRADTAKAQATAKSAPPVVKPGSANPMSPQTKEYLNFRKALAKAPENSPQRKQIVESRIADIFSRK